MATTWPMTSSKPVRHALCLPSGRILQPFGDPVSQARVLDRPLAEVQDAALAGAGLTRVERPPPDEPVLVYSDRTWFTPELIRRVCAAGPGRLRVEHPDWGAAYEPLQDLEAPGLYELGVAPPGQGPRHWRDLAPITVDLGLENQAMPALHPALAYAARPLPLSAAMVHQVDSWVHLHRINLLGLATRGLQAHLDWKRAPFWKKAAQALAFLLRYRPTSRWDVVAGLSERGKKVQIHPTATVELSVLEDGAEVGPHAVVRGSYLGKGARVEEFASMNGSVLGAGARLGRYGMLNLSVVYPGAMVSKADGLQACLVGQDAFLGWGVIALDLSFGKTIRVDHDGERRDTGLHFLGVCFGHRAKVTYGVMLNYGFAVPNDANLIGPTTHLVRRWGDAPVGEVCSTEGGVVTPVVRRAAGLGSEKG